MSMGPGYHRESQRRLHEVTVANGLPAPVITSAGALVEGLQAMGARRVSLIAPYMKPLTRMVIEYIENEGIEVIDSISLEIHDNLAVGACDPKAPAELWKKLNTKGADVIVASACVQMPSLASVPLIEAASGLPVVSSSVCTTYALLKSLGLERRAPNAGALLSGRY
jgi:maleate isomerase